MNESIFTIEFPMHIPIEKREYLFNRLTSEMGVIINKESENIFDVVCSRDSQVKKVGWALFHTHYNSFCSVLSASGEAVSKASAYSVPQKKRHSK